MPDLRATRHKVKIALAIMALVDLAALAVFLSPLVGSQLSRQAELQQLWQELQQKTREIAPVRGLDKKIPVAGKEIDQFYKQRFPSQDSAISENIGKLATAASVKIASIKYDFKDGEVLGLQPVQIEAELAGNYLQLVRFINSLERDQMFFLIDGIQLGGEQAGTVKLQMKFETYLKTGAA